jgi:hypothetical protein
MRSQRIEMIHEKDTKRMTVYSGPLGGILGQLYLNTTLLRQQFDGGVPNTLTITITGEL